MAGFTFEQGTQAQANTFVAGDRLTFSSLRPTDIAVASATSGAIALTAGGRTLAFSNNALGDGSQSLSFAGDTAAGLTLGTDNRDTLVTQATGERAIWGLGGDDRITVSGDALLKVDGGTGDDTLDLTSATGAAFANGGTGSDTIVGGSSNDHLYGNASTTIAGSDDGGDRIFAGAGSDYLQGNAGGDQLYGGTGGDRIYGGSGDDEIRGEDGQDSLQGNRGEDDLYGGAGNDILRGGQDDDDLNGGEGGDQLFGDRGNDELQGGLGIDHVTGGEGRDEFSFDQGDALIVNETSFANIDTILDYADGTDRIELDFDVDQVLTVTGQSFGDLAAAGAFASQALAGDSGDDEVVAVGVGSDTYLFFNSIGGDVVDSAIRLVNTTATAITTGDFS